MNGDTLELELGTKCNSSCIYCEQGNNILNKDYRQLDLKRVQNILRKGINDRFTRLYLQGGEPSIHPRITEIIGYAKKIGYSKVDMITNGRLFCDMQFTKNIIKAGLDDVTFSIHGDTAALHDFITQSPGGFDQAIQGIKNLRLQGHKGTIQASTVIIKQNYKQIHNLIIILNNLSIKQFHVIYVIPYDVVLQFNERIMVPISEVVPFITEILDLSKKERFNVVVENIPNCLLDGFDLPIPVNRQIQTLKLNTNYLVDKQEVGSPEWKKPITCKACKYMKVCKGIHKNYLKKFGTSEFKAVTK